MAPFFYYIRRLKKFNSSALRVDDSWFIIARPILLVLGIIALISITCSSWWLRPISWDGSRHTLQLIHQHELFIDIIRYSHVVFQLPTFLLDGIVTSPLTLTRIYFLTLTSAVFGFLLFRMLKARSLNQLFLFSSLFLIALLPGVSYATSSMLETSVFFFCFQEMLLKGNRNWIFYLLGLLAATGHQIFVFPFFLITYFFITRNEHKKYDLPFLLSLCALSVALFIIELRIFPHPPSDWMNVVLNFWNYHPHHMLAVVCFFILIFTNFLNEKFQAVTQLTLIFAMAFLLLTYLDNEFVHLNAHAFRIFTFGMTMGLVAFQILSSAKNIQPSRLSFIALILLSGYFVLQDVRITSDFRNVFYEVKNLHVPRGCHEISLDKKSALYTNMSLPVLKMIADDKIEIDSMVLNKSLFKGRSGCSYISQSKGGYFYYPTIPPFVGWMSLNGKLKISPSILNANRPAEE